MPIIIAPCHPKLFTRQQRCPSAEMEINRSINKVKNAVMITPFTKKNSVHFDGTVSVRSTTHINDMTDKEVADAWFSHREMAAIKRALTTEVNCMVAGNTTSLDTTSRGLEFRTKQGSSKRRANKIDSIHAVLDEQDLQLMRKVNEPEGLRKVYMIHSRRCLTTSQAIARADEIAAGLTKETERKDQSPKKDNLFVRLFTNRTSLMEEIKQFTTSPART